MEEALRYETIAKLWGFPPTVVADQPFELIDRMIEIAAIRSEVEERKSRTPGGTP